ncbi:TRAP transporter small permease [uncultured Cohaesibacter sp.]|uniref:TRAP transporter small permease n=1 Tax=uncultured Cohaesibacter sp. TaxID=1002546 RepID=UPI0029C608AB|nr:TRAP transporter small permease [uncultured Cohaesibacter sp.]
MLVSLSKRLNGISLRINRITMAFACLFLVLMVAMICLQVIARYGFASPPAWTEEMARYAMVWVGLLGASASFHENFDPSLAKIPETFPRWLRLATALVRAIAVLVFLTPVLWYCFFGPGANFTRGFLSRNTTMVAETISMPLIFVAISVPIFIVVTLFHGLARTFSTLAELPIQTDLNDKSTPHETD